MKCPECQSENPEEAKFCGKCGEELFLICPQCGSENTPGNNFCNECGHNLTISTEPPPKNLSFDEKLDKIQRYLPKGLTEKILSQRDRIEGERKQVTVMFCDMEGFTPMVERLGPEEAYGIMDQVYEILIHKVHDYEGTVNEMTGDGIMALFGAPIALEDAPQRAIRSSLAIHREMVRFSDKGRQEDKNMPPIKMRVGIHTGPVVVGTLGNNLRVDFKAVGDTVNLASRVEGLAEPGTSYVTEDVFKLTEGFFRFEALGEREVKGKEKPVNVYRVIAPSSRRTRFDVSAERGLTPFIGRERELEILLDGFDRAKAGRGQAFSIISEAGIGKSRLLYEFRKAVTNEDVTFLEGKCLSYSRSISYHPIIDVLKSNFDVRENDRDSEISERVKRQLKQLGIDEAPTLPYLLELLLAKDSGIDKTQMSPEARKDRIMEAVKRITLKGSEVRPLVIAMEDLHWIDKSSEEYLKDMLDSISGARVFLIFTYRPEFVHTWGGRSYHSQINLNRLSNRESLAMASHLLGTDEIDRDLEEFILEKTEGNPFFVEEFMKSLNELKAIEEKDGKYYLAKDIRDVTIPSTIQDVIMARVDALPEDVKEVLQTGSVIEREFSYELIKQVTGLSEKELLTHLSVLKDSELLYERGIYPYTIYIFKHALTREILYDSVLTKRKKNLHAKIGKAVEDLYQENISEYYGVLAEHFILAENYEKGAQYSKLACKKAEITASLNDGIAYAKKRVQSLDALPKTDAVRKELIDASVALGLYNVQMGYYIEAKEAIQPIIELALTSNYKRRISQIYDILGAYTFTIEEDFPKALTYLKEAHKLSQELKDKMSLSFSSFWLARALAHNCEFEEAFDLFGNALDISVAADNHWGISIMKAHIVVYVHYFQGNAALGHETSEEALTAAQQSGDAYSMGVSNTCRGYSSYCMGFLDKAEQYLLNGAEYCDKAKQFFWCALTNWCLGNTYFDGGKYRRSQDCYNNAISYLKDGGFLPSLINANRIALARARVLDNEKDINLDLLYGYAKNNKLIYFDGLMSRYVSEILLNIDDQHVDEAKDWIKKAIQADKRNGMMFHLARDYGLYAELFKRKGRLSRVKENLNKAIEIFRECGADGWVEKYAKELAALS